MNIRLAINQYLERHGFGSEFAPRAVLFDMDGVLYDSMPYHAIAWHETMKRHHINMSEKDAYLCEGMRGVETIRKFFEEQHGETISLEVAQEIYAEKSRRFAELGPVKKMDGVEDVMRFFHSTGMTIGVVTGSGQQTLLDRLVNDFEGMLQLEHIVNANDVTHGKPHPEPYLKGIEKCGVEPRQAIVVENAPIGVESAVAANIFTVAVNTGPLPDKLLLERGADLVFDDMKQFLEEWKKQLLKI